MFIYTRTIKIKTGPRFLADAAEIGFCKCSIVLSSISKDGYTLPADQSMPGLQVVLEVFELIFGCLFGLEVVLRLWGVGWSSLD